MTVDERFWAKVEKTDDCWFWTAAHTTRGYGLFNKGLAHRWAYERFVGPIPDGLTIDHLCAQIKCVNPAHMEPVPLEENTRRQIARMREQGTLLRACCKNGHPFTPDNIFLKPRGAGRECLTCRRNKGREWMRRYREAQRVTS